MQPLIIFSSHFHPLILILISTGFAFVGDYFSKHFVAQSNPWYILIPRGCYCIGSFFFIMSLFGAKFTLANIWWNLFSIGLGLLLGLVIFKEHMTNLQVFGIFLAVIGVICMSIE